MSSRLGVEVVQMLVELVATKAEVVDSTIEVVGLVATRVELVDSFNVAEVVDSTIEVIDPNIVKTKLLESFMIDEVVDATWPETLVVNAIDMVEATVKA